MPRVIFTNHHLPTTINGVKFTSDRPGQAISEEVTEEVAKHFASIPRFKIVGAAKPKGKAASASETKDDPADAGATT